MCDVLKYLDFGNRKNEVVQRTLKSGNHFGEIALIKNIPRTATIRAQDEVKVVRLNTQAFYFIQDTLQRKLKMDYGQMYSSNTVIKPYSSTSSKVASYISAAKNTSAIANGN